MKVKHLIKKLQELDPEANVYFGETSETKPADYLLFGTRLKREGYFMLQTEVSRCDNSPDPTDQKFVDYTVKRYGSNRKDLHNQDILITNWNGKWE